MLVHGEFPGENAGNPGKRFAYLLDTAQPAKFVSILL